MTEVDMIRILIAEPDASTRKALAMLLRRKLQITEIVEASDVETLIRALADTPPDLLLLDWKLYGSPGPETSRLLKKAYPSLKVILLSVDADNEAASKATGAKFIYKGAPPDELLAVIKPLIDEGDLEPEPGKKPANGIKKPSNGNGGNPNRAGHTSNGKSRK
jgi:DNA-binding NarL/FixJ family response regulator